MLACALFAAALPRPGGPAVPCEEPAERRSAGEWTLEVGCEGGPPLRGPVRRLYGLGIDPNRADAATLETLPGIGPGRAAAIVSERGRGAFAGPEDLQRVRGIGPRTVAGLARLVAVEPPPESR